MANKLDNLMPIEEVNSRRTREQHSEDSRKAGIRSGEVRREKATMKKTLELLLNEKDNKGRSYRELATLGLLKGAIKGNANNYRTILETLGELNSENNGIEDINKMITNIATLINNPVENRTDDTIDE